MVASPAPDPRVEIANVRRYLLSRWRTAVIIGQTRRIKRLRIALDTLADEWPEAISADEEAGA